MYYDFFVEIQGKSRHPVRRSNSSPEMSSSWKNPFHIRERLDAEAESNGNYNIDSESSDSVIHKGDENGYISFFFLISSNKFVVLVYFQVLEAVYLK
jgi:hypothetical protein